MAILQFKLAHQLLQLARDIGQRLASVLGLFGSGFVSLFAFMLRLIFTVTPDAVLSDH